MNLDFVIEMAWKSTLISGVALGVLLLLRSRSPADRAAVLGLAVVLLLMLPLVSLGVPKLEVERPAPITAIEPVVDVAPVVVETDEASPTIAAVRPAPISTSIPTDALLLLAYAAGVLLVGARLVGGLGILRRWTREAKPIAGTAWNEALHRARVAVGVDVPVRLLVSDEVPAPLSWGLRAPVILIDPDTLARPDDADAILAHEMAHVARRDWLMLMLSRAAVALFWFNPLVRLLERALVQHAEEAADLRAVGRVEPTAYARTLVACSAQANGLMLPANGIAAGGGLARRVRAVLDDERRRIPSGSAWTAFAMVACVALAAPIAALELVEAAPDAPKAPPAPMAPLAPQAPAAPRPPLSPEAPLAPGEVAELAELVEAAVEAEAPSFAEVAAIEAAAERAEARADAADRAAAIADAAADGLVDVDALIEMRVHGVTPAYLDELAAIGPRFRRLPPDEIVQMKIHGLTPSRLRQFAEAGYGGTPIDDLVAMQIHGVSPSYIGEMASAGYSGLSADQLVAMRIHGVTADGARRAAKRVGRPTPDELVKMKIHGLL